MDFGCGTVFKMTPLGGTITTLYNFCSETNCTDGTNPNGGVIQAADGNFYGTTSFGGANNRGTIFKITPAGALTTLYSFCAQTGCPDGYEPTGLVQGSDGNFYRTTVLGGNGSCPTFGGETIGCGTVFKLAVQTPRQTTQATINSVNALFSQGVLNSGQDNSLVKQLQQAIKLMNAGKNAGAIGNLESFISEVNDLLSSGVLSASLAPSLISAAESVFAQLS